MDRLELAQKETELLEAGIPYAAVTLVESSGTARTEGKMLVLSENVIYGTIGGGAGEQLARRDALSLLAEGNNAVRHYELDSPLSALLLTGFILLGAAATFAVTGLLSRTVLRGVPSSFTLELPPYRRPQWGQVIVRPVFDRTLFVLARAVKAAAPAGLLLWLMANLTIGGSTILAHCAGFLEPAGRALGMDGVILLAFLLGLPANEIVVPIMLMGYLSQGVLQQPEGLASFRKTLLMAPSSILKHFISWPPMSMMKSTSGMKYLAAVK